MTTTQTAIAAAATLAALLGPLLWWFLHETRTPARRPGAHTGKALRRTRKAASGDDILADPSDEATESWMHGLVGPAIVMACRPLVAARIHVAALRAAIGAARDGDEEPPETDEEFIESAGPFLPAAALLDDDELAEMRARLAAAEMRARLDDPLDAHVPDEPSDDVFTTSITTTLLIGPTAATWTPRPMSNSRDLPPFPEPVRLWCETCPGRCTCDDHGPADLELPPFHYPPYARFGEPEPEPDLSDTAFELPAVVQAALSGQSVDEVVEQLFGALERQVTR